MNTVTNDWAYIRHGENEWAVINAAGVTIALATSRTRAALICYAVLSLSNEEIEHFLLALNGD